MSDSLPGQSGPRVHNKRHGTAPPDAVYVGRPTALGNPFVIGKDGTREEVIEKYEEWLLDSMPWESIEELRGKDLVCWCAP